MTGEEKQGTQIEPGVQLILRLGALCVVRKRRIHSCHSCLAVCLPMPLSVRMTFSSVHQLDGEALLPVRVGEERGCIL